MQHTSHFHLPCLLPPRGTCCLLRCTSRTRLLAPTTRRHSRVWNNSYLLPSSPRIPRAMLISTILAGIGRRCSACLTSPLSLYRTSVVTARSLPCHLVGLFVPLPLLYTWTRFVATTSHSLFFGTALHGCAVKRYLFTSASLTPLPTYTGRWWAVMTTLLV